MVVMLSSKFAHTGPVDAVHSWSLDPQEACRGCGWNAVADETYDVHCLVDTGTKLATMGTASVIQFQQHLQPGWMASTADTASDAIPTEERAAPNEW